MLSGFLFHGFEVFGRSSFHVFKMQVPAEASVRHSAKRRSLRSSKQILMFHQPPISLPIWGHVRIPLRANYPVLALYDLIFRENLCPQRLFLLSNLPETTGWWAFSRTPLKKHQNSSNRIISPPEIFESTKPAVQHSCGTHAHD